MARLRDYALIGGFLLSFAGGLVLSVPSIPIIVAMALLFPGLLLFLWGLLTTPSRNAEENE